MKQLELSDGVHVTLYDPPPAAFDPFTAKDTERTRYGFPSLPETAPQKQRYQNVMSQLKGKFNYVQPTFEVRPRVVHGPRKPDGQAALARGVAGTETSGNWSGAVVYAPQGDSFKWIEGDFVVPNVGAPAQGSWYYSASWIGLDGDGSGDVCQAGVECEIIQSGSAVTRNIYPWWEWYPLPEVKITNFAVNPGDLLTMLLCSTGAGATSASMYLTNRTSGQSTSFGFNAPSGTKLVGNSAEWIVEAPTVGGSQSSIADYGEVFFSVCEAFTVKGATLKGGTGNNINLSAGGKVVSQGTLVAPTVAQCWYSGTLA